MAITGVSSISGEQIIAAGALSARSAATALYDENGNAITSYLTAVPEGYATTGDLNDLVTSISETYQPTAGMTAYQVAGDYYSASNPSGFISEVPAGTMNESAFEYDENNKISGYNGSAFAGEGGGSNITTANTGNDYNINVDGLDVYGTVTTKSEPAYEFNTVATAYKNEIGSYWSNFQFDEKRELLQSATKIIFTLYDCDSTYWASDSLEFNVLFSAEGFDYISETTVDYSALIGNIKMDITGNYPPPAGEIRVLTGNLDIPSAMKGDFSIEYVGIGFSGDFGYTFIGNQRWSAEAGYDEITGTSSISGIYIPNINDITAMSASIGDVETLLASL